MRLTLQSSQMPPTAASLPRDTFDEAVTRYRSYVMPMVEAMIKKVDAEKTAKFDWVKDKSHHGAVRTLDGRHLVQCQKYNSQTWRDNAPGWLLIKPKAMNTLEAVGKKWNPEKS